MIIVILNPEQKVGSKETRLFDPPMKFSIIRCEPLSVPLSVSIRSGVVDVCNSISYCSYTTRPIEMMLSSFRKLPSELQLIIKPLSEVAYSSTPRSGAGRTVVIIPLEEVGNYHCKTNILPFSTLEIPRVYV